MQIQKIKNQDYENLIYESQKSEKINILKNRNTHKFKLSELNLKDYLKDSNKLFNIIKFEIYSKMSDLNFNLSADSNGNGLKLRKLNYNQNYASSRSIIANSASSSFSSSSSSSSSKSGKQAQNNLKYVITMLIFTLFFLMTILNEKYSINLKSNSNINYFINKSTTNTPISISTLTNNQIYPITSSSIYKFNQKIYYKDDIINSNDLNNDLNKISQILGKFEFDPSDRFEPFNLNSWIIVISSFLIFILLLSN
ncbi:hypothetical protein BVG19_g2215 [[Candida] boidinii]|nr:hypothetical protein BVG19_g2215 [[Candida] boidinii]OWB50710.1 hypothetical protein B5S27_g2262 [[Candida] boidinii]OWB83011.1 hypothetical protein B5S33_g1640 [[Candida] boidinii]